MASNQKNSASAMEIDRLAVQLAKNPHSKVFLPLAEEYCKAGMWQEAAGVLEDGLKFYPGFITAMVVLGRAYDQLGQATKAKALLEEAVKLSPENLRAHRTLIKIYMAQGLTEEALRSCDVILGLNPRDEEALSTQAKLGRPAKDVSKPQKKLAPVRFISSAGNTRSIESVPADQPVAPVGAPADSPEAGVAAGSPMAAAGTIIETALQADDPKPCEQNVSSDPSPERTISTTQPSPHAETIARLESWLRSIQRERRDRNTSGEPSSSNSQ
ncbi:MAG: tetratricopeptide repeat protein [Nitrospira sp. CR1.3]|nr:tetratricopeptide repeat protein [Nitrospira sp. CR1.3]